MFMVPKMAEKQRRPLVYPLFIKFNYGTQNMLKGTHRLPFLLAVGQKYFRFGEAMLKQLLAGGQVKAEGPYNSFETPGGLKKRYGIPRIWNR